MSLHERDINFLPDGGHTHDGQNSTPVQVAPGSIQLKHLASDVLERLGLNTTTPAAESGIVFAPDVEFTTASIAPGASVTGAVVWVNAAFVRFVRIVHSNSTEAKLTFYHSGTFNDEDREFRVEESTNYFLWEGVWCHLDETDSAQLYYKLENTGSIASSFKVQIKGIAIGE